MVPTQGKSVVSRGRTVKEAISLALDILGEKMDRVSIEIIENESKGIFGIGAKRAVVRVTVIQQSRSVEVMELEQVVDAVLEDYEEVHSLGDMLSAATPKEIFADGKAWVKSGQIQCKIAPEQYPVVSAGSGMKLYINEELAEGPTVIRESDRIRVELDVEVKDPSWELVISSDKMTATLKVIPGFRIERILKDKLPDHFIQLEAETKRKVIHLETEPVLKRLDEMGIVHGIDYTEIANACTSDTAGSFIIATGTPPASGKNGYFSPLREFEIRKGFKERENGTIDYKEFQEFPSVKHGQLLGIIHPPIPGVPGTTITNESVPPPEVYPLILQLGRGVTLVENETKVIATEAGHPDIQIGGRTARFSVVPLLIVSRDVDFHYGNVHYSGNVEVRGSVQDGMLAEAQGSINILNNVNRAKVAAGSSVVIHKNIIAGEVTAGKINIILAELHELLGLMIPQFRQMEGAILQLSSASAFKVSSFTRTGLGPLIKILCDGKFGQLPSLVKTFVQSIESGLDDLDSEWREFGLVIKKGFLIPIASNMKMVEELGHMILKAEQLFEMTGEDNSGQDCFLKAGFAQNSQLYSSGDMVISGEGVYQSKLRAGGSIEIVGYVRGGEIAASKSITIGEAGTRGGVLTKIRVPAGEVIRIRMALEETVLQVGSQFHKFTSPMSNVYARLDTDGRLLLN